MNWKLLGCFSYGEMIPLGVMQEITREQCQGQVGCEWHVTRAPIRGPER